MAQEPIRVLLEILKNRMSGQELDWFGTGWSEVAVYCKQRDEIAHCIKSTEFVV
jgi:hypothetical protein